MNIVHLHIILFAKNWYIRPDFNYAGHETAERCEQEIEDLRCILSKIYGYEYCREDIWSQVLDVFLTYCSEFHKRELFQKMFGKRSLFNEFSETAEYKWVVYSALCKIGITKIEGLSAPDYQLFPEFNEKEEVAKTFWA